MPFGLGTYGHIEGNTAYVQVDAVLSLMHQSCWHGNFLRCPNLSQVLQHNTTIEHPLLTIAMSNYLSDGTEVSNMVCDPIHLVVSILLTHFHL
jgi:hypothetical protein